VPIGKLFEKNTVGRRGNVAPPNVHYWVALFARSLATLDYDFKSHPSFDEYARGVMASPNAPEFIKKDPDLRRRFSPGPLRGLGSGLIWRPRAIPE
jgi:hypothetical protein